MRIDTRFHMSESDLFRGKMNENTNNASLAGLIIETAPNRWFYIAANAQNEYATGP